MKKKIRRYVLFSRFLAFLLVFSCNKDELYEPKASQKNGKITEKRVNLDEIGSNTKLVSSLDLISKQPLMGMPARMRNDSVSTIRINTEDIIYIERGGRHSYTFAVSIKHDSLITENLILALNTRGGYDAYIGEYTLTEQEKIRLSNNAYVNLEGKQSFFPFHLRREPVQGHAIYVDEQGRCYQIIHEPIQLIHGVAEFSELTLVYVDCPPSMGGGGSGGNGNGNSNGTIYVNDGSGNDFGIYNPGDGSGNNSGGNSGILTKPNVAIPLGFLGMVEDDDVGESHCQTLKDLTKTDPLSANIKPIINQLKNKTNLDKEWYCNFERTRDYLYDTPDGEEVYEYTTSKIENGVEEGISRTVSRLRTDVYSLIGQAHTHPVETYPIPSWMDLRGLKIVYGYAYDYNKQDVFIMIVCHNGTVYSLKVDNFVMLESKLQEDLNNAVGSNEQEKWDNIEDELEKYYWKNKNNLEKAFLQKYGAYGVSIYKATDNNLTNWIKLELDNPNSNNPNVIPILCN